MTLARQGDAIRKWVFESGPISRQRWLHHERRWRRCTDANEVVKKSCGITPPKTPGSWQERYSSDQHSWTHWVPFLGKGAKSNPPSSAPADNPPVAAGGK